jgi:RHS repeat-associated protein
VTDSLRATAGFEFHKLSGKKGNRFWRSILLLSLADRALWGGVKKPSPIAQCLARFRPIVCRRDVPDLLRPSWGKNHASRRLSNDDFLGLFPTSWFTGKMRDTESNLDDCDARYYSSQWGRFMSPDWDAKPVAVPFALFGDPRSLKEEGGGGLACANTGVFLSR